MLSWRIFLSYLLVVLLICTSMAFAFFQYSKISTQDAASSSLSKLNDSAMKQIDVLIHMLDVTSIYIFTSEGFSDAMRDWSTSNKLPEELNDILLAGIRKNILYMQNIYKVCLFTPDGKILSYGKNDLSHLEINELMNTPEYMAISKGVNAKHLLPPHMDPWIKKNPKSVVSMIRSFYVDGKLIGYMEVQLDAQYIKDLCENEWNRTKVYYAIVDGNSSILLSDFPEENYDLWSQQVIEHAPWYPGNGIDTGKEIMSIVNSNYNDWNLAMVMKKSEIFVGLSVIQQILVAILIGVLGLAALFLRILIEWHTKPLYSVISNIEKMELDDLEGEFPPLKGSTEALALQNAFTSMQKRLRESIVKQRTLETLQNKALYDALQSRIDPHFLYNTLGSIANMCENGESNTASEACYDLSDLLRFSTEFSKKVISLQEELEGLAYYLSLMKCRYQKRLEYKVNVDTSLFKLKLPKMTIQPLVENAIKYSLTEHETVLVQLDIERCEGNYACIRISDNGIGFNDDKLLAIKEKVEALMSDPSHFSWEQDMGFGGMGLTGTIMRLFLYHGERFQYRVNSSPPEKVEICLHIPLPEDQC